MRKGSELLLKKMLLHPGCYLFASRKNKSENRSYRKGTFLLRIDGLEDEEINSDFVTDLEYEGLLTGKGHRYYLKHKKTA